MVASDRTQRSALVTFGPIAVLCLAAHIVITRSALFMGRDSGVYAGVAYNIAHGRGATVPFETQMYPGDVARHLAQLPEVPSVLFPPGYPALLASLMSIGFDQSAAARLINAAALVAVVIGCGVLVRTLVPTATAAAVVASLTIGLAPSIQTIAALYLSDLVFLAMFVWCTVLLVRAVRHESFQWRCEGWFWLLSVGAVLTRNVGVSLAIGGAVAMLFARRGPRRALAIAAPALVAAGLWQVAVWAAGERRVVSVHVELVEVAREGLTTVADWFAPSGAPSVVRMVALLAFAVLGAVGLGRLLRRTPDRAGFLLVPAVLAVVYLGVVVTSRFFVGDEIPLSARMFAPLLVLVVAVVAAVVSESIQSTRAQWIALGLIALGAIAPWRTDGAWAGVGRTSTFEAITESIDPDPAPAILRVAVEAPASVVVLTNRPERLWFEFERSSLSVPLEWDSNRGRLNEDFDREVDVIGALMRDHAVLIVIVRDDPLAKRVADRLEDEVCDRARVTGGVLLFGAPGCASNPIPDAA